MKQVLIIWLLEELKIAEAYESETGELYSEATPNKLQEFFDKKADKWGSTVKKEEDISRIRFSVSEDVLPITKGKNGTASLKVLVNY